MAEKTRQDDSIPLLMTSGTPYPSSTFASPTEKREVSSSAQPSLVLGEVSLPPNTCRVGEGAIINGHMSHIHFQDFIVVEQGAVVRPPLRSAMSSAIAQCPLTESIGAFTVLGAGSVCEAAAVGKYVRMDRHCVVGCGAQIADGVWLKESSWVPPEAVLAPYTVYGGCPATSMGKLNPEAYKLMQMEYVRSLLSSGVRAQ